MAWDQLLKAHGFDRYDRNARLYPAFLSLLPVLLVIAIWLPKVCTLLGGLTSLVLACGLIYATAQIVRYLGRRTERKLGPRVGRLLTATLLTHSDTRVPADTKARYHNYLAAHGLRIPDRDLEARDPAAALQAFRSAVDWLLEHTRPASPNSMLLNENIAYGFRRNLLGLKPVAVSLLLLAMAMNLAFIVTRDDASRAVAAGLIEVAFVLCLAAWLLLIREEFVEDASLAYAQRFLAHCDATPAAKKRPRAVKEGFASGGGAQ